MHQILDTTQLEIITNGLPFNKIPKEKISLYGL